MQEDTFTGVIIRFLISVAVAIITVVILELGWKSMKKLGSKLRRTKPVIEVVTVES